MGTLSWIISCFKYQTDRGYWKTIKRDILHHLKVMRINTGMVCVVCFWMKTMVWIRGIISLAPYIYEYVALTCVLEAKNNPQPSQNVSPTEIYYKRCRKFSLKDEIIDWKLHCSFWEQYTWFSILFHSSFIIKLWEYACLSPQQ